MLEPSIIDRFRIPPGEKLRLKGHDTGWGQVQEWRGLGKEAARARAKEALDEALAEMAEAQGRLLADGRYSVLMILQAMDAAGKDSTIKRVMSGLNPQGCQVYSFKTPSAEELDHTFLWRYMRCLPERGRIGIFNRSYYEDVTIVKVHPELLDRQRLPPGERGEGFWQARYEDINALERHLVRDGTVVLKFFLNVSKGEQRRRFLERLERPEKHWKFSAADLAERAHWDEYMDAYEDALGATSTEWAPWYVVPADQKWMTRAAVAAILAGAFRSLDLEYPAVSEEQRGLLAEARDRLEAE